MVQADVATPTVLTAAAIEEKKKLQKHFGRFDVLFFLLCTLVGLDTIGTVAANGGQGFTWLIVLAVLFFVPSALLFAELGSSFPEEGGPYVWTRMAFGHMAGAINNLLYWITNPVWMGGTLALTAVTAIEAFFNSGNTFTNVGFYIITMLFIWLGTLAAILSFQVGKWLPTLGAFVRFVVLGFFTVTVVVYAIKNGFHGVSGSDFKPSWLVFLSAVPVLVFNYVGFELPSAAGEEMTDPQKDVPLGIMRSAVGAVLLYGLPILGILLVLPTEQITNLGGFVDAIKASFTVYGGSVASDGTATLTGAGAFLGGVMGVGFVLALLTSGVAWIMGSDRALAVSGYDGAAPRSLGVISPRFGTPVRVNILSGITATVVCVLAHQLTSGSAAKYFSAVLGLTISTTLISYIAIFPAVIVLRRKYPDTPRPFRIPGGRVGLHLCTWLSTFFVVLGTIWLIYPGFATNWLAGAKLDDSLPDGWAGQRGQYTLSQLIPLAVFVLIGISFWLAGRRTRAQVADIADIDREVAALTGQTGTGEIPTPRSAQT
ncbi:MAG: APC family permease [Frankia sp.]